MNFKPTKVKIIVFIIFLIVWLIHSWFLASMMLGSPSFLDSFIEIIFFSKVLIWFLLAIIIYIIWSLFQKKSN